MDRRSWKKMASQAWMAQSQRSGAKSSGCFSPMGKLSSDLSGWSSMSTSSIIRHDDRKTESAATSARSSTSMDGCCLRRASRSTSIFSRALSCRLLIVDAVHRTTPREDRAARSFSTVVQSAAAHRSKDSVKTRLRMMEEKVARSVALDCSKRACGMVCITSVRPSPSMSASRGPTTVVLPPPMSICLTRGVPERTHAMNSCTSSTCAARSTMFCVNSKRRNLGSYQAKCMRSAPPSPASPPPPPPAPALVMRTV
mmetsp:Transcript_31070/g.100345  ORF Transcript_31070/g.100345 Transcript_31070/m.100345 type:complete len:255 (+) Transcript_31070:1741-2505(+)